MAFRVVSFYTINTPYERECKILEASLKNLNLEYTIYARENLHDWAKNCQEKAKVIRDALSEFPDRNIVFTDADSVVKYHPILFDQLQCDIAHAYLLERDDTLSGTVFFSNNDKVKKFVDRWIELNATNTEWDQRNMAAVLKEMKGELTVSILPHAYCYIFDYPYQGNIDPVIVHNQASRRFKHVVSKA